MSWAFLEMVMLGIVLVAVVALLLGAATRKVLFVLAGTTGLVMLGLLLVGTIFTARAISTAKAVAPIVVDLRMSSEAPMGVAAPKTLESVTPRAAAIKAEPAVVTTTATTAERPAWVDAPTGLTGGKYERTVSAGPFDTPSQSEYALLEQLRLAVDEYGDGYISAGAGQRLNYSNRELLDLAPRRWVQQVDTTVGPMLYHHARLELDDAARVSMKDRWKTSEVGDRLGVVIIVLVGLLLALAALYAALTLHAQRAAVPSMSR